MTIEKPTTSQYAEFVNSTKNLISYLNAMQESQLVWAKENFGVQTPIQMMMGILGELGELSDHYVNREDSALIDDIGDVGVYLMNYCNLKGWLISDLFMRATPLSYMSRNFPFNILPFVKLLPHHQLKGDQNIRGGTAFHDEKLQEILASLIWQLDHVAGMRGGSFVYYLGVTWSKVSKRDWVLNPNNADEVAEQST
jgi:NTP pyrophosphatase (non-canonical NTP hydrolase)